MPKSFHLLALLFTLPFLAAGCGQQETSFYPLAPGLSWEYQLSAKQMLGGGQASMTVTNLPPRQLGGRDVVPQKMEALGRSAFTFIAQDNTGIYEHASQEDGEPEIKKTPVYLLKYPVQVGTSWDDAYKTELLQEKIPVTIKSTIESVTEAVTVPAGTFNNCVKVRGVGKANKSMGLFGVAKIDVESTTWMCPGVGVVKSYREEDGHNLLLGGGKASMQLAGMRKDGRPISSQESGFTFPNWFGGQAKATSVARPSAAGTGAGAKQYLDSLFDRLFFPEGMKYTLTGLGSLGGKRGHATAISVNGTVVVVGWSERSDGIQRAFRWKDGVMTDLGTLGGKDSQADAVSADGTVVVGRSALSDGALRAFRWKDGVMTDLGNLDGGSVSESCTVSADGTVVVGRVQKGEGIGSAFRWKDGVMTDLGTLGGENRGATAVSADGEVVVGYSSLSLSDSLGHAFRWKDGVMTDLGTLGGVFSAAEAISADGTAVVGHSSLSDGALHIFRWKDGVMTDLGTLGDQESIAEAVSADGEVVVGASRVSGGVAFRWKNGVMTGLGTLGGNTSRASAVSAGGEVVVGLSSLSNGAIRAFRWEDGVMTDLGTLGGRTSRASTLTADGAVVVGDLDNLAGSFEPFIATPPRVAGMSISTARTVYYALLGVIAIGILIAFVLAVRYAVRRRCAPRSAPASSVQIRCSQCGSAQPPGAAFCVNCGARLDK